MTSKPSDKLTETTDEGKIGLNEEELNRVTGGTPAAPMKVVHPTASVTSRYIGETEQNLER